MLCTMAGISSISQEQRVRVLQNLFQKQQQPPVAHKKKTICYGSAKASKDGGDDGKLSADVSFVASGVAKDCTTDCTTDC